jgi:MFS superfamily sulfate permease-like transporter
MPSRTRSLWQVWRKRVPILCWLPKYNIKRDLKADVIAAFTVCVLLVPQEMSLAALMGVPAQYGLYSAAVAPLIYPIFGSSRAASVANTSEAGLLVGVILRASEIQSMEERVATGILITFFCGVMMIVSGFMHQGGFVTFFSRTAMNAYVTAMAFLTITSQVPAWLGISLSSPKLTVFTYFEICSKLPQVNPYSFSLGVISAMLLVFFKFAKRRLADRFAALNAQPRQTAVVRTPKESGGCPTFETSGGVEALVLSADGIPDDTHDNSDDDAPVYSRPRELSSSSSSNPASAAASSNPAQVHNFPLQTQRRSSNSDRVQLLERESEPRTVSVDASAIRWLASRRVQFVLQLMCDSGSLIVCVVGMIVGRYLGEDMIHLTGEVHRGLPEPMFPLSAFGDTVPVDRAQDIVTNSFMVSVVAFMSSVAMGSNLANKQGYHISATQELLGLGFANLASSFFQGMPSSMGMSRSVVNAQSARTPLASMLTAVLVMLTLLFLTAPLFYLPMAPLAALIIISAAGLLDFSEPKWLFHVRRREFFVWITAFASTVSLGLLHGLLVSVGASLIEIMGRTKKPRVVMLGETPDGAWTSQAEQPTDVLAVRVEQSLYFGNASHLVHAIERRLEAAKERGRIVGIVIDGSRINDVDASAIHELREYEVKLQRGGQQQTLTFANLRPETAKELVACGFAGWRTEEGDELEDPGCLDGDRLEKAGAPSYHDFTRNVASAVAFLRSDK